jgi:hypothetical protein
MKTTRVTVETETLMIVRRAKATLAWCPDCRAEVDVITLGPQEPASAAHIQEWLKIGKLHMWQEPDGPAHICLPSLLCCFEQGGVPKFQIAKETT